MSHSEEYDAETVNALALVWGDGFMAPGGSELVRQTLSGLDLNGKRILDIGCGTGGGAIVLARDHNAQVVAIDLEPPLVAQTRARVEAASLEDQIDVRLSTPGPLAFETASFDAVYSVGAFTQTPDKMSLFSEARRVLRPDGAIVSYDWTKSPQPLSPAMQHWIALEELTYELSTIDEQRDLLRQAGFVDVHGRDDQGWYAEESERELQRLLGPVHRPLVDCVGEVRTAHLIDNWKAMITVLQSGELRPAFFYGRAPV